MGTKGRIFLALFIIGCCLFLDENISYSKYQLTARAVSLGSAAGNSLSYRIRGLARFIYPRVPASPGFIIGEGFLRSVYISRAILKPIVTGITPDSAIVGKIVNITNLSGANFQTGAAVKLSKTGQSDIIATDVSVVSPGKITCAFNLSGAVAGLWDLTVTNPDGRSGTLPSAFKISYSAPTVILITPSKGINDQQYIDTKISGTAFRSGLTVVLAKTGEVDINGEAIELKSADELNCRFNIYKKATGIWDVKVTNDDGQSALLAGGFKLESPEVELTKPVELQVSSNPQNPSIKITTIRYNLSKDADIVIDIFNMRGEKIWSLTSPVASSGGQIGQNEVVWNGITAFKSVAPSGVYIIFLTAKTGGQTKLLSKLKLGIIK
ncbi:MAG: hypothetical protein WC624_05980 [Candidatus Margulisiibacteriota bacterium]